MPDHQYLAINADLEMFSVILPPSRLSGNWLLNHWCYADHKCGSGAKNICFTHQRVFNAECAETRRTQRKTL